MNVPRIFTVLIASALVALGQTAQVMGRITDSSGAIMPAVSITVSNLATGIDRKSSSNEQGYYAVPLLPPGNYKMSVQAQGFRPILRDGISLEVDQVARIDSVMEVGQITGSIAPEAAEARRQVAILKDSLAGTDLATADAIADALRREKFEIAFLSAEAVCDPAVLSPKKYFLYVIPNATSYPASGADALAHYLQGKGSLMVLGAAPFASQPLISQPLIETLSPAYKMYPLKDIASLKVVPAQGILSNAHLKLPVPAAVSSCYARPEGKGFERGYKWRWIPLVRAVDKDSVERGTAAWMLLQQAPLAEGPAFADAVRRLIDINTASQPLGAEGSVYAVCAIADPAALREVARTSIFGDMARRISDGLFLSHGGSEQFSYWPSEKVRLGAMAVNHGAQQATVVVRVRVRADGGKDTVFQRESRLMIKPGQSATAAFEWTPQEFGSQSYVVTTELLRGGKPIDVISHEMGVLSTEKAPRDAFVTVKGGDFWLEGKKWYPVGVNYWPRYAIALEQEDYVFHWLTPGFYNPEEVERDLKQLQSLGANFVAIRVNHQDNRRTLLDFLRRCRNHGIRVFVFVQSHVITDDPHYFQGLMMPYHFQEETVAEFIRATRLADNPTLLGWDLIWEPAGWVFSDSVQSFGWKNERNYRKRWDADWAKWIVDRYGSLANAEADWGMPARRLGDQVTSPATVQFREDGPWRVMVAAYRRFMDNLMSRKWNDATRTLRRLDPNHLVSFRQGNLPPIDFTLTATPKHVDFFAMEGYGFKPDATGTNAAGFINRYIHFTTKGKPYIWAEFGASVWDRAAMRAGENEIAYQGTCHELIYRVGLEAGANGASPWWLAGGYRVSENSDFGILNPDGTLRPSGQLLQQYAALFKTPRTYPEADTWFTMDRDAHSGGHWHIAFNEGARAFKEATAQGRKLGIRTPGTGTTSADTPLLAVGNTKYNGRNPPRYLDAEFNWFKIKIGGGGDWIELSDGERIRVPRNKPILAAASVGNLQEATWLTPSSCKGKPGAVYLATTRDSVLKLKRPIAKNTALLEDADFGESFLLTEGVAAETKVELQMTAEDRAWFGEKLRFTLEPY
ncbi:MAG: carboxypeptidase regulatory-like domain-containing protein [Acidobacteriota bacterium]